MIDLTLSNMIIAVLLGPLEQLMCFTYLSVSIIESLIDRTRRYLFLKVEQK